MADANALEQDIVLQRASAELLTDLKASLKPFLFKTTKEGDGALQIRRRVRWRDLGRLEALLDQFQELPQLLDPHLSKFAPLLADAFLEYLQLVPSKRPLSHPELLVPTYKAICRLLYRFCKVRGDKIIVRFFGTETRHIELLLSSIEAGTRVAEGTESTASAEETTAVKANTDQPAWNWEETYITLLWLSQLLLAPFDLASISSENVNNGANTISGFKWPQNTPGVALRVISMAIRFLESPGKEKDAAKVLLVRIAMRKDMQELGVMDSLVRWAISNISSLDSLSSASHNALGLLSVTSGLLIASTGTTDMDAYLSSISHLVQDISNPNNPNFAGLRSSAVGRKLIIKILRATTNILLNRPSSLEDEKMAEIIEATISHLLEALADQSTPVRLAASKALSIVALKLPEDMAYQIVEEVLFCFERNVVFQTRKGETHRTRDVSRVNSLEWHGLILTLSHLIYRRSIHVDNLPSILRALRLGLAFNQRTPAGAAVGSNVRDASCFGIWALARRYSTVELKSLKVEPDVFSQVSSANEGTALQILATELVVSASLDPVGNIRRGSSAALQELIGRHPDTIAEGIKIVQVVDYHAVASRLIAIQDVATPAATLSEYYYNGLVVALLGWRGISDIDGTARRAAAQALGQLTWDRNLRDNLDFVEITSTAKKIMKQLSALASRDEEERHGLVMALVAIMSQFKQVLTQDDVSKQLSEHGAADTIPQCAIFTHFLLEQVSVAIKIVERALTHSRELSLVLDAAGSLIVANCPLLRADRIYHEPQQNLELLDICSFDTKPPSDTVRRWLAILWTTTPADSELFSGEQALIKKLLTYGDAVEIVSLAAADLLFVFLPAQRLSANIPFTKDNFLDYIPFSQRALCNTLVPGRQGHSTTYLYFYFRIAWPQELIAWDREYVRAISGKFAEPSTATHIEMKVTILRCLAQSEALQHGMLLDIVKQGLNDYTMDARGDVGSLVRIEALRALTTALKTPSAKMVEAGRAAERPQQSFEEIFAGLMRNAADKLDRVRLVAQEALRELPNMLPASLVQTSHALSSASVSSKEYFCALLEVGSQQNIAGWNHWRIEFFRGFTASADTGSEDVIQASRSALLEFCSTNQQNLDLVTEALFHLIEEESSNDPQTDRRSVPCLEVMAFLFDMGLLQHCFCFEGTRVTVKPPKDNWHMQTLKSVVSAQINSTNIRKIEAAIKCYGPLSELLKIDALEVANLASRENYATESPDLAEFASNAIKAHKALNADECGDVTGWENDRFEALKFSKSARSDNSDYDWLSNPAFKRLVSLLGHRYSKVKTCAADEIFIRTRLGKGIDWDQVKSKEMGIEKTYQMLLGSSVQGQ